MEYLADTVALVRHMSGAGKIGRKAKEILKSADRGDSTIYISIFSMVEIMYLAEIGKISVDFDEIKKRITDSDNYRLIDLNIEIVETGKEIKDLELHDRLIVATAKYLKVPILTSDEEIQKSNSIKSIWR
ncbi:MAG: PIN domain-containing protein [Candidatus Aminicenantes bacterium]|nr:PIN domain-containing protein [Candidatus Aminicenantes bacterium]NIM79154.1 PIN domain-containing protein [Candidatus Aminicenantes bacterium]NIN18439.1 PIN domain-containing protein [Candidatus Aminicenantes bacterium]NIN42327.1 PIN domain-containing protein [Candidatus Aminicenantes bacterium]NIN85093.1 PIN domain-containing protein [Candidatus Aminicenantes bacterium]